MSVSASAVQDSLGFFRNRNIFVSAQMAKGYLLAHRTSLSAVSKDYTNSLMIELGTKTIGKKAWQSVYNNPSLGMGYFHSTLSNNEVLGKANALYAFIEVPYFLEKKWVLTYQFDGGLVYATKTFDLDDNVYNQAVGSPISAFLRFSYDLKVNLFKDKFIFKTGLGFTHISNGRTKMPNLGLNILDWHFYLAYNITPQQKRLTPKPCLRKKHTFIGLVSAGGREESIGDGQSFAGNITFEYEYAVRNKSAWGLGLDMFYDDVMREELQQDGESKPTLYANRIGTHVSYAHYYGKIAYIVQLGYYTLYHYNPNLPFYFRIGLRAKASKHLMLNISLKTHLARADILEFGLGYYFSR